MKRYGDLYSNVWDLDNIREAHKNAKRGKSHYKEVQIVEADRERYFIEIQKMLKNKTFRNSPYETFIKNDKGKERVIFKLPYFPDRIVQHCIMQVLEPIWMKTFIKDTYSSLKGRGIHEGVKRIKKALEDTANTKYCLKMDVRKFYPSIDHTVLKAVIRAKIKDSDMLWLLDEIIDSTEGVPIGNYLSQYFGNLYLSRLDHWLKEEQGCKYYFRYCDDMVVLHSSKERLSELRKSIEEYLKDMKLTLKDNWQVFPVDARGVDFLGYRFFHSHTLLRKSTAQRFKNKVLYIKHNWKHMPPTNIINSIMSYHGWMKWADCYNLRSEYINKDTHKIIKIISEENEITNPLKR